MKKLIKDLKELSKWHSRVRDLWPLGLEQATIHNNASMVVTDAVKALEGPAQSIPHVPHGYSIVPNHRGYVSLGTGLYSMENSVADEGAELIIYVATEAERAGGCEIGKPRCKEITPEPEQVAVRLRFESEEGLYALETQLKELRAIHFPNVERYIAQEVRERRDSAALIAMEACKDAAYLERNQVVSALAKCFPSGVERTTIEGWGDWHNCVYIELPTGQASWHFHDSQAYLFEGLPPAKKKVGRSHDC